MEPMLAAALTGDIRGARLLAFTQSLLGGVPDAGAWGGASKSDVEVRVMARNEECCRVLSGFLVSDQEGGGRRNLSGPLRVAVLYGAYHVSDLISRFSAMGLQAEAPRKLSSDVRDADGGGMGWTIEERFGEDKGPAWVPAKLVVWKVPVRGAYTEDENDKGVEHPAATSPTLPAVISTARPLALLLLSAVVYLALGAVDWWWLLHLSTEGALAILQSAGTSQAQSRGADVAALAAVFAVSYVQRRAALHRMLSQTAVEWDRPLFEDVATEAPRQ